MVYIYGSRFFAYRKWQKFHGEKSFAVFADFLLNRESFTFAPLKVDTMKYSTVAAAENLEGFCQDTRK